MEIFLLSFFVIVLASLGLATGLLLAGKPLKGSCATLGRDGACEACDCTKGKTGEGTP